MIPNRIPAPDLAFSTRTKRNIRNARRMSLLLVCFLLVMGVRVADAQCYTFSSGSSASLTVNLTHLPAPSNPLGWIYQYTSSTGLAGTVSLTVGQTKYTPASSPPITLILTVGDDPGINFSSFEISTGFIGTNNTVAAATVSLSWSGNLFPNGSLPVTLPPVSGASNPLMVVGVGATQTTYSSVSVTNCTTAFVQEQSFGVFRSGGWFVDWDGNGQWDATNAAHVFYFGLPGDLPVMGDWSGDGRLKPRGVPQRGLVRGLEWK